MRTYFVFLVLILIVVLAGQVRAQTVTSGYSPLAEGVYAFTADGGDKGFIVGCELGNDVKIIVSRDYENIEEYSVTEQLKLLGCGDQPVLVSAGFDEDGVPSALLLGISENPEGWLTFYRLVLSEDEITFESFPTALVVGIFDSPGTWANLCPFYARQETLEGYSRLYQSSYVFARPNGSYAGLVWSDNGIWLVEFAGGSIAVDRIYAAPEGGFLEPVWHACSSRGGKLLSIVAEFTPAVEEPVVEFDWESETEDTGEGMEAEVESSEVGEDSADESSENTGETEITEGNEGSEDAESEEVVAPETGEDEEVGAADDEQPGIPEKGEGLEIEPSETPEPESGTEDDEGKIDLILVSNLYKDTTSENVTRIMPPDSLGCSVAVDGRPFVFWFVKNEKGERFGYYWGLGHTDPAKVKPLIFMSDKKSVPAFPAMRGLGLPVLVHEEGGSVILRLNSGSSPDWVVQEAYVLENSLNGLDAVMGVNKTAYFILDGDKLVWHWHRNK